MRSMLATRGWQIEKLSRKNSLAAANEKHSGDKFFVHRDFRDYLSAGGILHHEAQNKIDASIYAAPIIVVEDCLDEYISAARNFGLKDSRRQSRQQARYAGGNYL